MNTLVAPGSAEIAPSIVDRARRGDQEAFAAVIRHYDRGLRSLAYRLLRDRDRMDDALQEAYLNAFRALPKFRGESRLGTWLYRITYNVCLDELERSERTTHFSLADVPEPVGAGPAADEELVAVGRARESTRFSASGRPGRRPPGRRRGVRLPCRGRGAWRPGRHNRFAPQPCAG